MVSGEGVTVARSHGPGGCRGGTGPTDIEDTLRRLAVSRSGRPDGPRAAEAGRVPVPGLDDRTDGLVRLAALVALGAPASSYRCNIEAALVAGATIEDVVATLLAVAPTVGLARLVSATPRLAAAVGYDIDAALEGLETPLDRCAAQAVRPDLRPGP